MKKAHSRTWFSNVRSKTQKVRRQNANVLRSRSVRCLVSHVIVQFPNSRHINALRTYFFFFRSCCMCVFLFIHICHYREIFTTQFSEKRVAFTVSAAVHFGVLASFLGYHCIEITPSSKILSALYYQNLNV